MLRKPERQRKNPKRLSVGPAPEGIDVPSVANRVRYLGSPQHKDLPSFAGPILHPKPAGSICPRELARRVEDLQRWLEDAIMRGNFSDFWQGGFPKYVWYRDGETVYEGQLMNPAEGTYKGYPLEPDQQVRGLI